MKENNIKTYMCRACGAELTWTTHVCENGSVVKAMDQCCKKCGAPVFERNANHKLQEEGEANENHKS